MRIRLSVVIVMALTFQGCAPYYSSSAYSEYKVYKSLNKALKHKDDVYILYLTSKNLEKFPVEIFQLKNLKVLSLNNNYIKEIPTGIAQLEQLERLYISKNKLKGLPLDIVKLENLKLINVTYNGLSEIDVAFIAESLPNCLIITQYIL